MAQVWGWKPARASQRARSWGPRGLAWLFTLAGAGAPQGRERARDAEPAAARPNPTGDYDAFVREHERAILNYLWRVTGDEQSAYDLAQETFLRAWQRFDQVRGYDNPRAWLFRVATNLGLTALSRRRTQASEVALREERGPEMSDPAGRLVERDLVRATLQRLTPAAARRPLPA